jgi:hypothetical protein
VPRTGRRRQLERWAPLVLILASLVLGDCLPGDRGKVVIVSSECSRTGWIRVSEDAHAAANSLDSQRPERLDAGATIRISVFDNDPDGFALAIAASEADVGKAMVIPHAMGRSVRAVVSGDLCP